MANRMKLIIDLPIAKEHGATKGREFEITRREAGRDAKVFFVGDAGEECAAFSREYVRI